MNWSCSSPQMFVQKTARPECRISEQLETRVVDGDVEAGTRATLSAVRTNLAQHRLQTSGRRHAAKVAGGSGSVTNTSFRALTRPPATSLLSSQAPAHAAARAPQCVAAWLVARLGEHQVRRHRLRACTTQPVKGAVSAELGVLLLRL